MEIQHAYLEERSRLSRELHDTLGHDLTAQRFDLEILKMPVLDSSVANQALERALARNVEAMHNLRRVVRALRPENFDEMKFREAIRQLVSISANPKLVSLEVDGEEGALSSDQRVALYRLVQEALTNAIKHAPGEPLQLHMQFFPDCVQFEASNFSKETSSGELGFGCRDYASALKPWEAISRSGTKGGSSTCGQVYRDNPRCSRGRSAVDSCGPQDPAQP